MMMGILIVVMVVFLIAQLNKDGLVLGSQVFVVLMQLFVGMGF